MHGRKREDEEKLTADQRSECQRKIGKYVALKDAVLAKRSTQALDEEAYQLSAKLLEINPDFYSLWNYRRDILNHFFETKPKEQLAPVELKLTEAALMKNPKSYGAWHHRVWTLQLGVSSLQKEIELCGKMLTLDSRNFHCWNYRRIVADMAYKAGLLTPSDEFAYTTEQINKNFSNYSAWHYRSVLVPQLPMMDNAQQFKQFMDKEFQYVQNAFATDPADQSSWLYHRWLLARVLVPGSSFSVLGIQEELAQLKIDQDASNEFLSLEWQAEVFERELVMCQELLEMEPDGKWVLLTTALLLVGVSKSRRALQAKQNEDTSKQQEEDEKARTQIADIFERLLELDPMRRQYYLDTKHSMTAQMA